MSSKTEHNTVNKDSKDLIASFRSFLEQNPDFFAQSDNQYLLETLTIPHNCGKNISLLEYQVKLFCQQRDDLYSQIERIIEVHQINKNLLDLFLQTALEMVSADNLTELTKAFSTFWRKRLEVDLILVAADHSALKKAFSEGDSDIGLLPLKKSEFPKKLRDASDTNEVCCLKVTKQVQKIFSGGVQSGSFAFVPVGRESCRSHIVLFSKDTDKFSSDMQPDMVSFVCEVFIQKTGNFVLNDK